MSTKIYNAYKLAADADVFQLQRSARTVLAPLVLQQCVQKLVDEAVYRYDEAVALQEVEAPTFRKIFVQRLKEHNAEKSNDLRHSSIVVLQNEHRGERYIMCFGALTELGAEPVLAVPGVEMEFPYWDNADGPDDMSDETWQDRGQAWDEALPEPYESVSAQGLKIELFSDFGAHVDLSKIVKIRDRLTVPTQSARADRLGLNLYLTHYLNSNNLRGNNEMVYAISQQMSAWSRGEMSETTKASFITRANILLDRKVSLNFE